MVSSALAFTMVVAPVAALAQSQVNVSGTPHFGEVRLEANFTPDPHVVTIQPGGHIEASSVSNGCVGQISASPDYRLRYTAGSYPLTISAVSEVDTTLVVNGPDGRWTCDDDSGGDFDPKVTFGSPRSGVYDIWVGTYQNGGGRVQAHLAISEVGASANDGGEYSDYDDVSGGANLVDLSADALYGTINLRGNFSGDPRTIDVVAGGPISASDVATGCSGYVSRAPDVKLRFDGGSLPLTIGARSSGDMTLMINGPDGRWYCDDDSGGNLDPSFTFDPPQSGVYDIWIGSFDRNNIQGQLYITELD